MDNHDPKPSTYDSTMTTQASKTAPLAAVAAALTTGALNAADSNAVNDLIEKIKSPDDKVRGPAWQSAASCGPAAVKPLAEVALNSPEMEVARAAKRALWKIVRQAGRPGADEERKAVEAELIPWLTTGEPNVRRDFVWMLSEIGGDPSVKPLAALLADKDLREDARAALQRIPGRQSLAALKSALETAPADYRPAIAVSLRVRGVKVKDYPDQKLVPTRPKEG
jgi:HEAT repeat protein